MLSPFPTLKSAKASTLRHCLEIFIQGLFKLVEVESVISVSGAEIEPVEEEEIQTETENLEDNDSLGPDITKPFSSAEKESLCKATRILPPQELIPFLAACELN